MPPTRPGDLESPPELRLPEPARNSITFEKFEPEVIPAEEKASLSVRLRVILGSAVILWALIIWAAWSIYGLIRGS